MVNTILTVELFALVVSLIILYASCFETRQKSEKKKAFVTLNIVAIISISVDALTWVIDGKPALAGFNYALIIGTLVGPFVLSAFFIRYLYLHIREKDKISYKPFQLGVMIAFVFALGTLAAGIEGWLFRLDQAMYVESEFYWIYLLTGILLYGYIAAVVFWHRNVLGKHDSIGAMSYVCLPLISIVLNIIRPEFEYAYSSMAIVLLIIYVMLQSEHENTLIEHYEVVTSQAHHDGLTGLNNRLAYTEKCESVLEEGQIGVLFCDVNALKYTNDHFGHKAGDRLLCDFRDILVSGFRREEVYRISGDEFVVLMPGMGAEKFDERVRHLRQTVQAEEVPKASIGSAYGEGKDIVKLIELAEEDMYQEKKKFHDRFPSYGRR